MIKHPSSKSEALMWVGESGESLSICKETRIFIIHKLLLGYPIISNPEGQ